MKDVKLLMINSLNFVVRSKHIKENNYENIVKRFDNKYVSSNF